MRLATSDPRDPLFAKPIAFPDQGRNTLVGFETALAARGDARPPISHHTRSDRILRPVEAGLFFQEDGDEGDICRRNPANAAGLTQGCRADL